MVDQDIYPGVNLTGVINGISLSSIFFLWLIFKTVIRNHTLGGDNMADIHDIFFVSVIYITILCV